jgi:hypothetical protein
MAFLCVSQQGEFKNAIKLLEKDMSKKIWYLKGAPVLASWLSVTKGVKESRGSQSIDAARDKDKSGCLRLFFSRLVCVIQLKTVQSSSPQSVGEPQNTSASIENYHR